MADVSSAQLFVYQTKVLMFKYETAAYEICFLLFTALTRDARVENKKLVYKKLVLSCLRSRESSVLNF